MASTLEFTTSEASALTEQPVNRIQKFIDNGPIPRRVQDVARPTRVLVDADLMFIWVVARAFSETDLDAPMKRLIYDRIMASRSGPCEVAQDEVALNPYVTIRGLRQLMGELRSRLERLERARAAVESNPEIKGGEPVIRGTRVPVYLVSAMVHQGTSAAEILESFPTLTEEAIELAEVYAHANPRQGRPPKHPWR